MRGFMAETYVYVSQLHNLGILIPKGTDIWNRETEKYVGDYIEYIDTENMQSHFYRNSKNEFIAFNPYQHAILIKHELDKEEAEKMLKLN
jgi:hypothetical protein